MQKQFDAQQPGFAFGYDEHLPSHLSVGDRVQIDAVSGSVYVDGENVMDLPADIQNTLTCALWDCISSLFQEAEVPH